MEGRGTVFAPRMHSRGICSSPFEVLTSVSYSGHVPKIQRSPKNDHPNRMVIPSDEPERGISRIAVVVYIVRILAKKLVLLDRPSPQLPPFRMHPPRKGYQQDALFAGNKVEFSPLYKVHRERAIFLVTFRPYRFSTRKQPQAKSRGICTCRTKELSILK